MAALLTERYDIDEATALTDATELANQWIKTGIATL
jgi:hypothetical protein